MKKKNQNLLFFFLFTAVCILIISSAVFPAKQDTYQLISAGNGYLGVFDEMHNTSSVEQEIRSNLTSDYLFLRYTSNGEVQPEGLVEIQISMLNSTDTIFRGIFPLKHTTSDREIILPVKMVPGNYRLRMQLQNSIEADAYTFNKVESDEIVPNCLIDGIEMDGALQISFATKAEITAIPWLAVVLLFLLVSSSFFFHKPLSGFLAISSALCAGTAYVISIFNFTNCRILVLSLQSCILFISAFIYSCRYGIRFKAPCFPVIIKESCILLGSALLGCIAEIGDSYFHNSVFLFPRLFFFSFAAYGFLWINFHFRSFQKNLAPFFLVAALTSGTLLSVFVPATTLVSWDDEIHYSNTVYLSQGIRGYFTNADTMMKHRAIDKTFSLSQITVDRKNLEDNSVFYSYKPSLSSWMPGRIGYLPHVIGMWIAQILALPFQYQFLAGRLCSMFFCSMCIYWGMKRLKSGQSLLFLLALFPTVIFQSASYSYDGWLNALTMLGFAYFIGALQRPHEPITALELCVILFAPAIGCLPKAVYGCILPIFLLMPREKFTDKKSYTRYLLIVCTVTAITLATYVIPFVLQGAFASTGDNRGGDVSGTSQLSFIFSNPASYTKILLNFLKDYLNPKNSYGYTGFLAYLGGTDLHWAYMILMFSAALFDRKHCDHTYQNLYCKIVPFILLFGTLCLAATALYLSFNPIGNSTINGFQPRYLIPMLYPATVFLFNLGVGTPNLQKTVSLTVPVFSVALLFWTIWSSIISLYVA